MTPEKRRRRPGLAAQVFIGLGLGILVGFFFGEKVAFLKIAGDAFIALLQMTVIPYVVVALITSLGRLTMAEARVLGVKAGSVLLLLWAVGLVVVFLTPLALPDWPSASFFSPSQAQEPKPVDFLQLYIPANFFNALANAVVPAIVVFSILFGLALMSVANKEKVLEFMSPVADALTALTGYVGALAPYGVFAITASAAGTTDVADLGRLQVYVVIYVVMSMILSFWLLPALITTLTPLRYGAILRAFQGPLVAAFATGSVLIVLPMLAAESKNLVAASGGDSGPSEEDIGSPVDILIPAAYPFPQIGLLLSLMFVLFGGWYVGSSVPVAQYPTLAVAGLASLFGGTVLALPFLFDLLSLPADLFQVFVTVDVIGSRFGTVLAAMHIIAIALIGTYALRGRVTLRFRPLLRFASVSVALLVAAVTGIRAFYTYVFVEPYTKDQLLAGLHLIENPQPHTVNREWPKDMDPPSAGSSSYYTVRERGVLKACYVLDDYPSAFFNDAGELVGFDIEMTHRFARQIGVTVDFLPVHSYPDMEERLAAGYCDAAMSLVPITPFLTEKFAMTAPVLNVPVGMIVKDHDRREFQQWQRIREKKGLRVAILDSAFARSYLAQLLPDAPPVIYRDKRALDRLLAADAPNIDAFAIISEEGAAWTILYPSFTLVPPSPPVFLPMGYVVARSNTDMLLYLDTWLLSARSNGTIDQLYKYWMLGQVKAKQPPRWSIIRNVLGWVE